MSTHATPVKTPNRVCFCCGTEGVVLVKLSGEKVKDATVLPLLNFILCEEVPEQTIKHLFVCRGCFSKIVNFGKFQENVKRNGTSLLKKLQRPKRGSRTPLGATPKRLNVSDQLIASVEKLNLKDDLPTIVPSQSKSKKTLFKKSEDDTIELAEPLSDSEMHSPMCSEEECLHIDHLYSLPSESGKEQVTPLSHLHEEDHGYCLKYDYEHDSAGQLKSKVQQMIEKTESNIMDDPQLKDIMIKLKLVSRAGKTVLHKKAPHYLSETDIFSQAVSELAETCPFLLKVLLVAVGDKISVTSKISTIGTIYGMIMHCINNKASAIQRLFSTVAIRYHADNKLLGILNTVHVTLSDTSKDQLLDSYAKCSEAGIIKAISSGADGKLNGDNLDLRVTTNDVRMTNKSKDYHFFATDFVIDRVDISQLSDVAPMQDTDHTPPDMFLPAPEEVKQFRDYLKILLAKMLVEHCSGFKWMEKVIPKHVPHERHKEMSEQSSIHLLPIILKNEISLADCVDIMQEYVSQINQWYAKSGRGGELDKLRVPVGGDQLTRIRLQAAKALREGTHTRQTRFEQLDPVVIELFHTLLDFLEKLCKKFLKLNKGLDKGTLGQLKMHIQRTNVNGQVKVRFKAHEQFIDHVGTSYMLRLAMDLLEMDSLDSPPKDVPTTVNNWNKKKKEELMDKLMDKLLDHTFIPPLNEKPIKSSTVKDKLNLTVTVEGHQSKMSVPIHNNEVKVSVGTPGRIFIISAQADRVKQGLSVKVPGLSKPVFIIEDIPLDDDLHNYAINFVNWFFVAKVLKDAIAEGNMFLTNVTLKFMVPLFYSHSTLSKYFIECIDYILKTEIMLSPKVAMKVRAASFVNPSGRIGHNKAADMQKENQVLVLKDLIKGLGANKTEKSIIKVSKVAPVVESIANNVIKLTDTTVKKTHHKPRSAKEDIVAMLSFLKKHNPWKLTPGRQLSGFRGIKASPFSFENNELKRAITVNVERLKRGFVELEESENEEV